MEPFNYNEEKTEIQHSSDNIELLVLIVIPMHFGLLVVNTILFQNQIPENYNYNILCKKNLSNGQFISKFEILSFDVTDVTKWMLAMRRECKTTYLSTNCKKPDSVIFKVITNYY